MPDKPFELSQPVDVDTGKQRRRGCAGCGCSGGCLTVVAVLSLLLGLFIVSVPAVIRHFMMKSMTTADNTRLQTLLRTPVNFPADWQQAPVFSLELKAGVERTAKAFDATATSFTTQLQDTTITAAIIALQTRNPITPEAWTSIGLIVRAANSVMQETSAIAHLPDYTAECIARADLWENSATGIGLAHTLQLGPAWALAAHESARAEDWPLAFHQLETAFRLGQAAAAPGDPASRLRQHLIRHAAIATAAIVTSCTQVQPMHHLLHSLREIRPRLVHASEMDPLARDAVGKLRQYARDGFPSNLQPGQPGAFYILQGIEAEVYKYPKFMAENLPFTDPRRPDFEQAVRQAETMGGVVRLSTLLHLAASFVPDVVVRVLMQVNPKSAADEQRTNAYVDLAALALASRLYEVERNVPPGSAGDLVPAFIEAPLQDPFSGKAYLWDSASARFYSVGPDGKNDYLKTISGSDDDPGDIVLGSDGSAYIAYWP
ncbi:MAG: hypothetical protein ACR2IE_01990 [Candidatus Sumerlaeaceae bacterium]